MLLLSSRLRCVCVLIQVLFSLSLAYPGARKPSAFSPFLVLDDTPPSSNDGSSGFLKDRAVGFSTACRHKTTYNITEQHGPFDGAPRLVAGEQCASHAAGCSIASGKMYGVTVTTSVGAQLFLTIPDILQVGVTSSVSLGTATTEAITTTVVCPSNCVCGIQAVPQLYHVEGWQINKITFSGFGPCGKPSASPYAIDLPVIDPGASKENQAVVTFSACRVANSTCFADKTLPACPARIVTH